MVNVGIVRMRVLKAFVPVRMRVRLARRITRQVLMLVMLVVDMFMLVGHCLVYVPVFVSLGDVEPDADSHERTCN